YRARAGKRRGGGAVTSEQLSPAGMTVDGQRKVGRRRMPLAVWIAALVVLAVVWGGSVPLAELRLPDFSPLSLTPLRHLAAPRRFSCPPHRTAAAPTTCTSGEGGQWRRGHRRRPAVAVRCDRAAPRLRRNRHIGVHPDAGRRAGSTPPEAGASPAPRHRPRG